MDYDLLQTLLSGASLAAIAAVFLRAGKMIQKVDDGFERNDEDHVRYSKKLSYYGGRLTAVEHEVGVVPPPENGNPTLQR